MSAPHSFGAAFGRLSWLGKADALALASVALLLSALLWPAWTHNPDLTHGLLMPIVFVLLLRESRQAGPPRFLRPGLALAAAVGGVAFAGLAVLAAAGLYSAVESWSNALVEFLLAAALTLFCGAGLLAFADERIRLLPLNWSSAVAIGLWPLSAPIPPGTYSRLTLALQLWVSSGVMDVLQLLHVAAHRQGNIIELATGSVGVAEACSGVRSLVSCVFVGLFFSATLVRRPLARALVIVAAPPLALAMNFLRSLALTLLVNGGVDITGFWHGATGFAVLGITAALLAGLALGLGSGDMASSPRRPAKRWSALTPNALSGVASRTSALRSMRSTFLQARTKVGPSATAESQVLAAALAFAAVLIAFYGFNLRPAERRGAPVPDLLAVLPAAPPDWTERTADDLSQFAGTLQTDVLAQRIYAEGQGAQRTQITIYLAYWRPGQAPVALVAAHTPDACWPAAGWQARATPNAHAGLFAGSRPLAPAESRLFTYAGFPQYVWFWQLYDGHPIPYQNPYSLRELASIAWHYGFRHDGDQMFISVASNRPWDEISGQPLLREFFAHTQPLGL
jgi:exosortase